MYESDHWRLVGNGINVTPAFNVQLLDLMVRRISGARSGRLSRIPFLTAPIRSVRVIWPPSRAERRLYFRSRPRIRLIAGLDE
jgi:hypothetical protein